MAMGERKIEKRKEQTVRARDGVRARERERKSGGRVKRKFA